MRADSANRNVNSRRSGGEPKNAQAINMNSQNM